jgi:hypothetical protein
MKRTSQRITLTALLLAITLTSCGSGTMEATPTPIATTEQATSVPEATMTLTEPAQPRTEEIRFRSGDFELVGDLRFPAGDGPHPATAVGPRPEMALCRSVH